MREVLSLSFPQQTTKKIKQTAKQRGFNTVSGYIKYLFESDSDLISADELLRDVNLAEKEYEDGRTIKAKTLADLL